MEFAVPCQVLQSLTPFSIKSILFQHWMTHMPNGRYALSYVQYFINSSQPFLLYQAMTHFINVFSHKYVCRLLLKTGCHYFLLLTQVQDDLSFYFLLSS